MKVILIKDVPNVGKKNEIVEVNDGYAKNYLIAKKLAVSPSNKNLFDLKNRLTEIENNETQNREQYTILKKQLESKEYKFFLKVNKTQVFGSVNNKQIIDEVNKEQKLIDKFMFNESNKLSVGNHIVKITLYKDIVADLKINVVGVQ